MALVAVPRDTGAVCGRHGVVLQAAVSGVRIVSLYERGGQEAPLRSIAAMIEVVSEEPLRLMPITMIWERARWRPSGPRHRSVDAITRSRQHCDRTGRTAEVTPEWLCWLLHRFSRFSRRWISFGRVG